MNQLGRRDSFVMRMRKTHPMSGRIRRVRLDSVGNYVELRGKSSGFESTPLPRSLKLRETMNSKTAAGRIANADQTMLNSQTLLTN